VTPLDPEFARHVLAQRIVKGAAERDAVRLHGAILAALELHPEDVALRAIFAPALRTAQREHGRHCRHAVAMAIRDHLAAARDGRAGLGYGDVPACASE
jgi:hypothetical protein